jgi:hypothetical protein
MPNDLTKFEQFLWSQMVWIYELIVRLTPDEWTMVIGFIMLTGNAGLRLRRFTRPETPRSSQFIRHAARALFLWPSLVALVLVALLWAAFYALCHFLDVTAKGLIALHSHNVAMVWGIASGSLAGGLIYYRLIPGLELPSVTLAAPNAKLPAMESYDPEKLFRD